MTDTIKINEVALLNDSTYSASIRVYEERISDWATRLKVEFSDGKQSFGNPATIEGPVAAGSTADYIRKRILSLEKYVTGEEEITCTIPLGEPPVDNFRIDANAYSEGYICSWVPISDKKILLRLAEIIERWKPAA